ncbi:hypothetical protein G8770_19440 [Aestuariicella hydrocarbonica]|uniref:Uncharacterized protein n=1 Tax=Pseudomaricurvus hydrocarbonicus TaxID=1470433 RepID=A0A9E5T2D4_9GAMM|nr:hypothetical protein [Aestuariicella hydrocarbonica]NHO67726.1 hypothetical protein [Aestuariicella hydrocarbonica]
MLYRGYFSLAHWSSAGEQFWVRYCAEFQADVFQGGGAVLRKLASRKMQELNAGGISIEDLDIIPGNSSNKPEKIDCVGIFSRALNGGERIEFRI